MNDFFFQICGVLVSVDVWGSIGEAASVEGAWCDHGWPTSDFVGVLFELTLFLLTNGYHAIINIISYLISF